MKISKTCTGFLHGLALSMALLPALWSTGAQAVGSNLSGRLMAQFTSTPILTAQVAAPLVLIAMSLDHQYWQKAYNDYSDLNGDGVVERSYLNIFEYYGYFHAERCYIYSENTKMFTAVGVATGTNQHYCEGALSAAWSGNFLNWVTMTRMDIVRKILYGGQRSTDTPTQTTLERTFLPGDAHAFAKYYNGPDIAKLTPFDTLRTDTLNGGNNNGTDDSDEGISFCNISHATSGNSQTSTALPLLRVAKANYALWNANERRQCTWQDEFGNNSDSNVSVESGIYASAGDPADTFALKTPSGSRDHVVRVEVCAATYFDENRDLENCTEYGPNRKPEGLLQTYGLGGLMQFGLLTGSYRKNLSGGVLRKRIAALDDEINTTDGTFKTLSTSTPGIIKTLNAMRIWGYGYTNGTYLLGDGGDDCNFQLTDIRSTGGGPGEGKCASWGNPMSEIYLEAIRYFASTTRAATTAFDADDSTYIAGLTRDTNWAAPLTTTNACASLSTIVFNASVSSYDEDQTNPSPLTSSTAAALTKTVGDGEGITGNNYFIGRNGSLIDEYCTAKPLSGANGLGDALGLCPEAPTLRGSYHMAGLAHWAHTNDISATLSGVQTVRTFAVSLQTGLPVIQVPVTGGLVKILPAYRLRKGGNNTNESSNVPDQDGGGTMVDFKVVRSHTQVVSATNLTAATTNTGFFNAKFYVNWEDSEQGGDFDQDMWGTIEYLLNQNVTPASLKITTKAVAESTSIGQLFGFVTNGTTQDGFHAYSGIEGANYYASTGTDPTGVPGCSNCRGLSETGGQRGAQSYTFTVKTGVNANLLESPLYYAAKWGGFEDSDANKTPKIAAAPGDTQEWDADGDGIPDTFFFVSDPGLLEAALRTVFNSILERVSSGTAAAVVANEQKGNGAIFQALYDPEKKDADGNTARWIGTLQALFVDSHGLIREDGNANGKLDDYATDKVVRLEFDDDASTPVEDHRTKAVRYTPVAPNPTTPDTNDVAQFTPDSPVELSAIKTLWNARKNLSALSSTSITTQRTYSATADTGRYIFTWLDGSGASTPNNSVASGETVPFVASTITAQNYYWLDYFNTTDTSANKHTGAQRLVDWVRGKESVSTEFRSRLLDYDGVSGPDGVAVMRLGDIVNSTPVSVGAPFANFDQSALDPSYATFRALYSQRRQVVYVGANDGMIHAFNAGFYNADDQQFQLGPTTGSTLTRHPLGSEIWAYVPKNALPHLQWLARPDYSHVYTLDLPVRVFDVKSFPADSTHSGGWGTILVAGMRFGGGTDTTGISVDVNADGAATANVTTKSAYVVLDITNPELAPTLLAELSPTNLQFSTAIPQVVAFGDPSGTTAGKWYLVFGSGPTDFANAQYVSGSGNTKAQLFVYDLANLGTASSLPASPAILKYQDTPPATKTFAVPDNNVFIGDPASTDFDLDMKDEAIYFGTVGALVAAGTTPPTTTGTQGSLFRLLLNENSSPSTWTGPTRLLSNLNQAFVGQPAVTIDSKNRRWVLAATGRLLVNGDKATRDQQTLYGIIDTAFSLSAKPAVTSDLVDVSAAQVFSNDTATGVTLATGSDTDGNGATSTLELRNAIATAGGWRKNLTITTASPAERSSSRLTLFGGIVFGSMFTPSTDLCTSEGTSRLLGLDFTTGSPPTLGVFDCANCNDPTVPLPESLSQGGGYSSSASVHLGEQTIEGRVTVITQDSRGELEASQVNTSSGNAAGEISWRENRGD